MEYLSLLLKTVWPFDHKSKDWSSSYDIRWKHKTSDQCFQEGLKVEHLRGNLCTKGAGGRRKSSEWLLGPVEINSNLDRQNYYAAFIMQGSSTSLISVVGIVKHSCHRYNFHLQLENQIFLVLGCLYFFSYFQITFIYNLYCFLSLFSLYP